METFEVNNLFNNQLKLIEHGNDFNNQIIEKLQKDLKQLEKNINSIRIEEISKNAIKKLNQTEKNTQKQLQLLKSHINMLENETFINPKNKISYLPFDLITPYKLWYFAFQNSDNSNWIPTPDYSLKYVGLNQYLIDSQFSFLLNKDRLNTVKEYVSSKKNLTKFFFSLAINVPNTKNNEPSERYKHSVSMSSLFRRSIYAYTLCSKTSIQQPQHVEFVYDFKGNITHLVCILEKPSGYVTEELIKQLDRGNRILLTLSIISALLQLNSINSINANDESHMICSLPPSNIAYWVNEDNYISRFAINHVDLCYDSVSIEQNKIFKEWMVKRNNFNANENVLFKWIVHLFGNKYNEQINYYKQKVQNVSKPFIYFYHFFLSKINGALKPVSEYFLNHLEKGGKSKKKFTFSSKEKFLEEFIDFFATIKPFYSYRYSFDLTNVVENFHLSDFSNLRSQTFVFLLKDKNLLPSIFEIDLDLLEPYAISIAKLFQYILINGLSIPYNMFNQLLFEFLSDLIATEKLIGDIENQIYLFYNYEIDKTAVEKVIDNVLTFKEVFHRSFFKNTAFIEIANLDMNKIQKLFVN
eukprot:TRINITY_DN7221_c0_g1_i1.p1 TRINITY_DN7221_c0_g1~~TRINITY_DN7221_c0_g1_i1.p1  ORF type:complete len:630 (+),score=172.47 TRINITY_DN7221_c0_g1_i1:143-1891(+)